MANTGRNFKPNIPRNLKQNVPRNIKTKNGFYFEDGNAPMDVFNSMMEHVEKAYNELVLSIKSTMEEAFLENQDLLETVQLLYEGDKDIPKVQEKRIPMALDIKVVDNVIEGSISASSDVENKVLKTQYGGTGFGINEEVLKLFGVSDEVDENDMSSFYMNPTGADTIVKDLWSQKVKKNVK